MLYWIRLSLSVLHYTKASYPKKDFAKELVDKQHNLTFITINRATHSWLIIFKLGILFCVKAGQSHAVINQTGADNLLLTQLMLEPLTL